MDLPLISVWYDRTGWWLLELGEEGQICQNMRRKKLDALRRDDIRFKIKLHKKLYSWVTPNQNNAANGLIVSMEIEL
jgi:hypothetical protein